MKKTMLCLLLLNLSLFSQNYIEKLYEAIENNDIEKIEDIVNKYDIDLNNTFLIKEQSAMGATFESEYLKLTPLNYSIECNNLEAVNAIIKLGANIEHKTECKPVYGYSDYIYSFTPLMYCVNSREDTEKIVSFLIQNGANINSQNRYGTTALMYACCSQNRNECNINAARILMNAGANIHTKDNEGKTSLMYAAYSHDSECVDLLIKNKADIDLKDKNKRSALMYACMGSNWGLYSDINPDVLKLLINAGASINEIDEEGNTALLYAVDVYRHSFDFCSDDDEINIYGAIKLLIDNGANVNIKNKDGKSALSLSRGRLTKLLIDSGAY